eukprot:10442879-Karenia_brevis.AAC.1
MVKYLSGKIPPCVFHALFYMWCNAWPTKRRFQYKHSTCLLGTCCHSGQSEDSIEHYGVCAEAWRVFRICYGNLPIEHNLASLMLVKIPCNDLAILLACHAYAIFSVSNYNRHNACHLDPNYNIKHAIKEFHNRAFAHSAYCSR